MTRSIGSSTSTVTMPVTRQMEQDGFKHIMENVLNVTPETRKALEQQGIDTIPDLLNEPFDILDKLEYCPMVTGTDGNPTPARAKKQVARGSICQLMIFMDYCSYRFAQSDPISDWTTVTHDQYNNFRLSHDYMLAKNIPGKTRFTKDPNSIVIKDFFQSAQPNVATPVHRHWSLNRTTVHRTYKTSS